MAQPARPGVQDPGDIGRDFYPRGIFLLEFLIDTMRERISKPLAFNGLTKPEQLLCPLSK
jgi:hypothetical protein